jgi:hypothetical protein
MTALSGLQVGWEKHPGGTPDEGMPGPHADEHARKVIGLSLVQRGEVPARITPSDSSWFDNLLSFGRNSGKLDRTRAARTTLSRIVRQFWQLLTPHEERKST